MHDVAIFGVSAQNIRDYLNSWDFTEQSDFNRYILDNIAYSLDDGLKSVKPGNKDVIERYLLSKVRDGLARQKRIIHDDELYKQFVREATLKAVDDGWVELIDYLEQLKYAVSGRASAQRNVMFEYQNEAFESYLDTEKVVKRNIIRNILLSDVTVDRKKRLRIVYP